MRKTELNRTTLIVIFAIFLLIVIISICRTSGLNSGDAAATTYKVGKSPIACHSEGATRTA
jgi:hypothetical protein